MLNAGCYIFSGSVITSLIMDTIEYLNGEVKKGHFFSFIVLLHDFRNRVYEKCEGSGRTERKVVQG